jgi:hypothetical protein
MQIDTSNMQHASAPPPSPTIFKTPPKRSASDALRNRVRASREPIERTDPVDDDRADAHLDAEAARPVAPHQQMPPAPPSSRRVASDSDGSMNDACATQGTTVGEPVGEPLAEPVAEAVAERVAELREDGALLAILDAPLFTGEPASVGFARKERELRDAFAALPILQARALEKRLAKSAPGDSLAQRFGRLTAERKHRLLQFLADARRRAAIAGGRGR